ncbi:hypothetical protein HN51_020856 [Arachis hypogaea]|nr:transcription factor EGL1 isoform X2 [Arachis hypogaea]XP_025636246.1 transcription factor EGL1 isoform X2 [Arachis hypogaea]XP_025636253.1 transcription factor EGL1 isoform X2 [Arachis hypogaea]XP_025636258.1 transcription factor EGL1 isoform X2 [Arachis hypogaea]QHO52069.1 Transcription factor [Arachis hypogaea]QHO52070.1 Transcription factor [Arachis hypogaea]QHO52071.1 Transcription factor [Arachis hypogaea]QHO52072.1 Transcription factor [Arachis hypogaea]QHO52073.1 Transcription fa
MASSWSPKHEKMQKSLSTQLAVAVRSVQWSYGIFWAPSTTQEGVLEWREGYYNGDIKTMKTVQTTMEIKNDKIGVQRSEQLKELYKFLLVGESDPQTKRPSAALSPEDLSDSEWYYLVCMSFVFYPNQSLPGRALEIGETIWLCNAQYADSKVFSRSLLAKSASIQTVVCFPYLGGVIEIGTTELVPEDPNLIQHVKACLLEFSKPICSDKSSSALNKPDDDKLQPCSNGEHVLVDTKVLEYSCSPAEEIKLDQDPIKELQEDSNVDSPDGCSNGCEHNCRVGESMVEAINNGGPSSQVHFMDDDDALSNGAPDSLSSCDCLSEASENRGKASKDVQLMRGIQSFNHLNRSSLDAAASDEHLSYTRILSALLGRSSAFKQNPYASNSNCKSSFVKWKKGGICEQNRLRLEQSLLKKTLFTVPLMHRSFSSIKSMKENETKEWTNRLENADDKFRENVLSDKIRETGNYKILKSSIPHPISEVEKISILGDTIKYLKELETRVEELESYMDMADSEARTKRKCPDMLEQISDNYEARKVYNKGMRKPWMMNKRKACDIDEKNIEEIDRFVVSKEDNNKPLDVKVNMKEQEVLIEMQCPYREYILHDIMDAINNLHLDAYSVESSTNEGVLTLTLKSKFRGTATAPLGMIKEALWKVSGNL